MLAKKREEKGELRLALEKEEKTEKGERVGKSFLVYQFNIKVYFREVKEGKEEVCLAERWGFGLLERE